LRIGIPYNFSPLAQGRLAVFGTAEYGIVKPRYLTGSNDTATLAQNENFMVITPSHWSAAGFGWPMPMFRRTPLKASTYRSLKELRAAFL
jgi:hypothetical protein